MAKKITEARRLQSLIHEAQQQGGYSGLAQSVLITAIIDWRRGWRGLRDDVRSFWYSDYGWRMRACFGLDEVRIEDIASSPETQRRLNL